MTVAIKTSEDDDGEEEVEIIPENNKSNSSCPPCTQFSIRKEVAKHLRSCSVPRVN